MRIKHLITSVPTLFSFAVPFSVHALPLKVIDTGLNGTATNAGYKVTDVSVPQFAGTVINVALGILGIVFLVLIVYGGMLWMLSEGDDTKVGKARGLIFHSIIGLIVVLAAYAITSFIVLSLIQGTLN